jgi:oligosaccharide translocation protein RFT1
LFSKLLADNESRDNSDNNRNNRRIAVDTLLLFLRFHVLLGMIFIFFATNYTATLIDLIAGKTWSVERNTPSVLAVYCVYVPIMGINGITEAFVQAVATKSDLGRLSYYMFAFSVAFMIAGVVFMQLLQLGGIGLILANMVNLGIRIAYSWYFIRHYFKGDSSVTVSRWFPHRLTVSAFILAWCVTRWSEVNVGFHTLRQKIIHIGIGAVCFGLVSIVM